jgi:hypothetical protein
MPVNPGVHISPAHPHVFADSRGGQLALAPKLSCTAFWDAEQPRHGGHVEQFVVRGWRLSLERQEPGDEDALGRGEAGLFDVKLGQRGHHLLSRECGRYLRIPGEGVETHAVATPYRIALLGGSAAAKRAGLMTSWRNCSKSQAARSWDGV